LEDSILLAVVAETFYLRYLRESEGKLVRFKAKIVSAHNLSGCIYLGKSGYTEEVRQRENLLCAVFKVVTGVIYLDDGFENGKKFILKF
jgi:dsRNA-specific ribonuclease